VFVLGKPFKPGLIFANKAIACLFQLKRKLMALPAKAAKHCKDKHPSIFVQRISNKLKKLMTLTPGVNVVKSF
jgi:hypothetical protein